MKHKGYQLSQFDFFNHSSFKEYCCILFYKNCTLPQYIWLYLLVMIPYNNIKVYYFLMIVYI